MLVVICAGCETSQATPSEVSAPMPIITLTPAPAQSAVVGQAINDLNQQPQLLRNTIVKLAGVVWNADKTDGAYFLDAAFSPSTITDANGVFVFDNLKPGDYIIVIGDPFGAYAIVTEASGKAKVFTADKDQVLNVGKVTVKIAQ